uniref:Uncharacterized protein n=1 Tax=Schistosoma curassoni TaxID=6186 RepID=A0A183KSY3_9TREM
MLKIGKKIFNCEGQPNVHPFLFHHHPELIKRRVQFVLKLRMDRMRAPELYLTDQPSDPIKLYQFQQTQNHLYFRQNRLVRKCH